MNLHVKDYIKYSSPVLIAWLTVACSYFYEDNQIQKIDQLKSVILNLRPSFETTESCVKPLDMFSFDSCFDVVKRENLQRSIYWNSDPRVKSARQRIKIHENNIFKFGTNNTSEYAAVLSALWLPSLLLFMLWLRFFIPKWDAYANLKRTQYGVKSAKQYKALLDAGVINDIEYEVKMQELKERMLKVK